MTTIMAAALLYFMVVQNKWSWHLVGRKNFLLVEVRRVAAGARLSRLRAAQ